MKQELEDCAQAMADHLVASLGEKVDLIIRYGSTIRNLAHEGSDIDICWIPSSEDSWECITVDIAEHLGQRSVGAAVPDWTGADRTLV